MSHEENDCFYFGAFRLDAGEKVLFLDGVPVNLPPKAVETLLVLVQRAGHVVEKDELMRAVWPDVFVDEGNLSQYVFLLRRAFGARPAGAKHGGSYIETIPRRGYRFVATVSHTGHVEDDTNVLHLGWRAVWKWAASGALILALLGGLWTSRSAQPAANPSEWVRLTGFPDSVSSPTLSPDGRLLAFLRGPGTFTTAGQIWIKTLPDGEAVRLTDDEHLKMGPVFSPDGTRIAYTVPWDTWEVPLAGGEPSQWLPNASGLTWIDDGRILFSEIKTGLHMAIMMASRDRARVREVYAPAAENMMAHRSYVSPDRRWALVVEMETAPASWLPCRLISLDGASPDTRVGPPESRCTSAAWSPDGRWMYIAADAGAGSHIWRQSFPDGAPEQLTFGPTEEDGIAITPDGESFITAVGLRQQTVWVHEAGDERQVSTEGHATQPQFSPDGSEVYFLKRGSTGVVGSPEGGEIRNTELWRVEVETGRSTRLFTGFDIETYDLSDDGRTIAFRARREDRSALWLASIDRQSPPRELAASAAFRGSGMRLVGDSVFFAEDDAGGLASIYRMNVRDGARTLIVSRVNGALGLSPDARWIVAAVPDRGRNGLVMSVAFPLAGGSPVPICDAICTARWDLSGRYFYLSFPGAGDAGVARTFMTSLAPGESLPDLPPEGLTSPGQAEQLPGWVMIEQPEHIVPGTTPSHYAFTREVVHRNLYQIPIK